jgi:class 3 adenylate cyclase
MMPAHVFKQLKEDNVVTEKLEFVTLLFADIVGFTQWSSTRCSVEVIEMLSKLFTKFDESCVKH